MMESVSSAVMEVLDGSTTPRTVRRSLALSDIDPKYVSQSGIWEASDVETSRGSIRIQHLTSGANTLGKSSGQKRMAHALCASAGISSSAPNCGPPSSPRFPKLEECAHFHYDCVQLPALKIQLRDDPSKPIAANEDDEGCSCAFSVEVVAGRQSWTIRRNHKNLELLDCQLHRCVWDRSFSRLPRLQATCEQNKCRDVVEAYLGRLSELPASTITCGTVLSWFELDNRGRHVVSTDDSAINTPAVAAACALKKYSSQAPDEISFEIGDMISVIDMPRPEESIWWRGKRGFHVGFFPREYVQVIGDKIPAILPIQPARRLQRLSVSSSTSTANSSVPDKPVLKKHGKLIAFFRSFILSRPSRRRLKQSGILRERVFSCDLAEHLLNSGKEIPTVLECCAQFIEKHGIVDGVYRLSGITSNIQKLRNAFDEDKIPNLEGDLAIKQDIHAVSSLLKMYFRELPNPLCTYQLYDKFVAAAKSSDEDRLFRMREVIHELPPPHYRTLEYLMKHLSSVARSSSDTGMTPKNMAIVWAPNLIRCKELENGGVAALKGIGVQAVVTEYLIRHADLMFNDNLPENLPMTTTVLSHKSSSSSSSPMNTDRPKSLQISSPIKLMSLEEAQNKVKDDRKYIEVGGGPSSLPPKYHTVIELPSRGGGLKIKRAPIGWRHFFSRHRSFSKPQRRHFTPGDITVITRNMPVAGPQGMQTNWASRLRPVKSVESLASSPLYNNDDGAGQSKLDSESVFLECGEHDDMPKSSPATPKPTTATTHAICHQTPLLDDDTPVTPLQHTKTHNRSISHDSYFEFGEFRSRGKVYIDETLEEETTSQTSRLSLELSSSEQCSNFTSPVGNEYSSSKANSMQSKSDDMAFKTPFTPPPSAASMQLTNDSNNFVDLIMTTKGNHPVQLPMNDPFWPHGKWRDSEVQTSQLKLSDVGVSTNDDQYMQSNNTVSTSTSVGCNMDDFSYEMDKNSSYDDSSELSTPDDPKAKTTNIVYSPLVNDAFSSTSSSLHTLKISNSQQTCHSSDSAAEPQHLQQSSWFSVDGECHNVNVELHSSNDDQIAESSPPQQVPLGQSQFVRCIEVAEPQYENEKSRTDILKSDLCSNSTTVPEVPVYENERIYENHPSYRNPQLAKSVSASKLNRESSDSYARSGIETSENKAKEISSSQPNLTKIKPKAKEPLPTSCANEICDKGEEAYENINECLSNEYELTSNFYEDIDEEEGDNKNSQHFKGNESSNSSNRYEMVGAGTSPGPLIAENVNSSAEKQKEIHDDNDNPYENIHFNKTPEFSTAHVTNHLYTEIEGNFPTANTTEGGVHSDSSTPSHSRTDDMITYLEMMTPNVRSQLHGSVELGHSENNSNENSRHHYERVGTENGDQLSDSIEIKSPDSAECDSFIRFIDSPSMENNPLYSLETHSSEEFLKQKDNAAGTPEEINRSNDGTSEFVEVRNKRGSRSSLGLAETKSLNFLGRCNSAPLTDTQLDFTLADSDGNNTVLSDCLSLDPKLPTTNRSCFPSDVQSESFNFKVNKIMLSKRLSEPLLAVSMSQSKSLNQISTKEPSGMAAWKAADAKRLANRQQSVKQLLSKFEFRDSPSSSSTESQFSQSSNRAANDSQRPGLPKPTSNDAMKKNPTTGRGNGRFQHHRFSVGDILMTRSLTETVQDPTSTTAASVKRPFSSMVRSDTFPELRTSSKVLEESASSLAVTNLQNSTSLENNNAARKISLGSSDESIDKVQKALRVAMTSVDMNDPNTRERIEKYKQERRTFLRQKIISEISNNIAIVEQKPASTFPIPSTNNCNNNATESFPSQKNLGYSCESHRKRAFMEESPTNLNSMTGGGGKLTKALKTEPVLRNELKSKLQQSITATTTTTILQKQDDVNVKQKVAMWTVHKKDSKSTVEIYEGENAPRKISTTNENQIVPPTSSVLSSRREVTTSSFEITKSRAELVNRDDRDSGNKKIKDIAAFFESKRL